MVLAVLKGGRRIMKKVYEVGKIVVNKCLDKGYFINTQKLQKLMVLMQLACVKKTGKCLFKEDIVIWTCGVAIKEVDAAFRQYSTGFTTKMEPFILLLDKENESVDEIIELYGAYSTPELKTLEEMRELCSLGVKAEEQQVEHITAQKLMEKYKL